MGTKRDRNDFINFVMDSIENPKLADEFLSKKTPKQLHSFFHKKGFKDIPYNDCDDILMARKRMRGGSIPRHGEKISPTNCPPGAKNY